MTMIPILATGRGKLFEGDCLEIMPRLQPDSIDLVFADPPFNLGKTYSSRIDDSIAADKYVAWCYKWIDEVVRLLKPGGAFFLWNLPKWNAILVGYMSQKLTFRNWIAVDIKYSLPISKRLYPSHYSLLYFIKGDKPGIFHPDRIPVPCCRHCGGEIPDYGGYKDKMNPRGVSLSDVWTDIPPVRHRKYKRRQANELPLKLMDRVLSLGTDVDSVVLDPFGGSGTTYVAAELCNRNWIGIELDCTPIVERFDHLDLDREHLIKIHSGKNVLFKQEDLNRRRQNGKPLPSSYRLAPAETPSIAEVPNGTRELF